MSWRIFRTRLRGTTNREQLEQDMDEEMRFHVEMATQRNVKRGMDPAEARRQALVTFGGVESYKESGRDVQRARWFENVIADVRFALRSLRRTPAFTIAAVLTVALGVGANTAVFSVVNGVLLRPLPVPHPSSFHYVGWNWGTGEPMPALTPFQYEYVRDHSRTLAAVASYQPSEQIAGDDEASPPAHGIRASEAFFRAIGVAPDRGRAFDSVEDRPGGPDVVILGDAFWRTRFGEDARVLGGVIRMDGKPLTVVGIMPASYRLPGMTNTDYILPLRLVVDPANEGHNWTVIARSRDGVSASALQAEMSRLSIQFRAEHPALATDKEAFEVVSRPDVLSGDLRLTLWILLAAVLSVLLIGCANTANLLLVRASGRQREIAVRASLGAGRGRIVQQLLTEGLVLSGVSAVVGVLAGMWGLRILMALAPASMPRADEIGLDVRVVSFVLLITIVTGMAFGVAAALPALRVSLQNTLRNAARGSSAGGTHARDVLVLVETALAVVLLAGAGLLITSFANLNSVDPGFRADGVLAVRYDRMPTAYTQKAVLRRFESDALARVRSLPGVESAAAVANFPLERGMNFPIDPVEHEELGRGAIELRAVSTQYFATLGVPLRAGRDFDDGDNAVAPRVAVVNEALAERWWPGENPIGKSVHIGHFKGEWMADELKGDVRVVGISADVREIGLDKPVKGTVAVPRAQVHDDLLSVPKFIVKTSDAGARQLVHAALTSMDSRIPAPEIETMEAVVDRSIATPRFRTLILAVFAGCALLLAAVGIYGVIAAIVQQSTRDIGVRMALGATRSMIALRILRRCMSLVVLGALTGTLLAMGLTRFLSSMLFGVMATDARTFALVVTLLCGTGALAGYLPARRAARVDPSRALRAE